MDNYELIENNSFVEQVGAGKHKLTATVTAVVDGISIYLGGGDKPHIGTVVISQPRPSLAHDGERSATSSVINLLNHKDDLIAIPLAEHICKTMNKVVVISAGVHIDQATEDDLAIIAALSSKLATIIIDRLQKNS